MADNFMKSLASAINAKPILSKNNIDKLLSNDDTAKKDRTLNEIRRFLESDEINFLFTENKNSIRKLVKLNNQTQSTPLPINLQKTKYDTLCLDKDKEIVGGGIILYPTEKKIETDLKKDGINLKNIIENTQIRNKKYCYLLGLTIKDSYRNYRILTESIKKIIFRVIAKNIDHFFISAPKNQVKQLKDIFSNLGFNLQIYKASNTNNNTSICYIEIKN